MSGPVQCHLCGKEAAQTFQGYCGDCFFDDEDNGDCWQCGGEGFVFNCFEEFACIDPENGCELCLSRCDVCNPRKPKTPEAA